MTKQRPTRAAATKSSTKQEPAPLVTTTNGRKKAVAAPKATPRKETQGVKPARPTKKSSKDKEDSEQDEDEDEDDDDPEDNDFEAEEEEDEEDDRPESEDDEPEDSEDDAFQDSSYSQSRKRSAAASTSRSTPASKKQAVGGGSSQAKSKTTTKTTTAATAKAKKATAKAGTVLPEPTKIFAVSTLKIPHPKGAPFPDAIQPETLEFIRDLKLNNDREYMMLNQERCDAAKSDFIDFIRMLKEGLMEADGNIMDQEPKDSMMRI